MNTTQIQSLCLEILEEGRRQFGMMLGIVSRIDDETYEIFAVSTDTGIPEAGDKYPLLAVYCREVFQTGKTVAITEINGVQGMCLHPLYDAIPCEAYISSPIRCAGKIWGTLNFTSFEKRTRAFSAVEIAFNESQAARISATISQMDA